MTEEETKHQYEELLEETESFLELLAQKATMTDETRVALNSTLASIKKKRAAENDEESPA